MPIYEYVCPVCHTRFDQLRPMSYAGAAPCPDCGSDSPRVLSVIAAVAKSVGTTAMCGEGACMMPGAAAMGGCGDGCACAAA